MVVFPVFGQSDSKITFILFLPVMMLLRLTKD